MFGTWRTLLALMVVASHLGGVHEIGGYAVFGFFTLSGYLMTFIMQTNYGYTLSGVTRYATNRFLRIYPIYWVAILFSVVIIVLLGQTVSSNYHGSMYLPNNLIDTVKNLVLYLNHQETPRLSPPAWALTVEIFFYVLIGLGISKTKKYVWYWLIISLSYHVTIVAMGLGSEYRYYPITAASMPFATGAIIYHYKDELNNFTNMIKAKKYLPFIIFSSIILNWYLGAFSPHRGAFFYSNFVLCSFMVIALFDRKSLPYISRRFDKWMGDFSYPIYLIHYQVGLIVIVLLGMVGLTYERPHFMVMFASLPLIFLFSWILTVAIENPVEIIRIRIKKYKIGG